MGAAQSYISAETVLTTAVIAGAVGLGYTTLGSGSPTTSGGKEATPTPSSKKGKKKKQKAAPSETSDATQLTSKVDQVQPIPRVVPFPEVIPGQFEATISAPSPAPHSDSVQTSKSKKSKKKKSKAEPVVPPASSAGDDLSESSAQDKSATNKKATVQPEASTSQFTRSLAQSTLSVDTDGSWTRVASHRSRANAQEGVRSAEPTTSDAGITTSTGNSSPVAEHTEEETFLLSSNLSTRDSGENRKTLAEKLLPKPRKTGVDDMLETSDYPSVSRVMRIQPLPHEKPAVGFSWADYEDVRMTTDGGENDADGEDDGWGVVQSKRSNRTPRPQSSANAEPQKDPESLTKRQRQNAQKREREKAVKADAEKERLAALAKHKRDLEKARVMEQYNKPSGKTASGGMTSSVNDRGKLVWD